MGRAKPLTRARSSRSEQRRFLIYCEGERTEDQYFKGLRQELRPLPVTVCIGSEHGEPKSLVKAAIAHKKRAPHSAADRHTAYDEVWCVMDVESPKPHPSLDEALDLAAGAGIAVVLTNPCFELWVLLHFRDVNGYHTSEQMQRALEKEQKCGYRADRKHLDFGPLSGGYQAARQRARALRRTEANPREVNPSTDLDRLVDSLWADCRSS